MRKAASMMVVSALLTFGPPLIASADQVYEVRVIPCTQALCGADGTVPIDEGELRVDDSGEIHVELRRAVPDAALCVLFAPSGGDSEIVVGDLSTDAAGDFKGEVGVLEAQTNMGSFLIGACTGDSVQAHYVTGFTVSGDDDSDGDDDGVSDDDDSDDDNDGVSDDDDSDANGDGIDDSEDCDDDHIAADEDSDDDNDGISDENDPDDDNDGIVDGEDADPDCPGEFDGTNDETTLKAEFKSAVRQVKDDSRVVCKDARAGAKTRQRELKDEFRARRDELRGD